MLQAQSGIEADEREAAEKRACDLGNSDACFLRGLKARDNHDIEGAIQLMERACSESVDGGSVGACWNLAVMHAKGEYTAQDWPRYLLIYSTEHHDARASPPPPPPLPHLTRAAQYFERACNLGESKACVLFDRFRTQGNFGKVVPKKSSGSAEN
jgi:TPR repeat protein